MKNLYKINFIAKMFFLLLTPTLFRYLVIGFIWHSIHWGVITFVVLLWGFFILISPLLGRIGCGWLCFFGTIQDIAGDYTFFKLKKTKPILWLRLLCLIMFFASALSFFFIRNHNIRFAPFFLTSEFNLHYKYVWMIDTVIALIFGLLLEKRWACKNICYMGAICAAGASYSRLLPVIDINKCNQCGICENICPVKIPILDYITKKNGLVTNAECLICGKCVKQCKREAIELKFIWNRDKYIKK